MTKLADIYKEIQENNTNKTVNLDQLFELSLTHKSIDVLIFGQNKSFVNQSYIKQDNISSNLYIPTQPPINSFAFGHEDDTQGLICFTTYQCLISVLLNNIGINFEWILKLL